MKFETLEKRTLLSVSFSTQSGLLTVNGTSTNDVVLISQTATELDVFEGGTNYPFAQPQALKTIKVTLGSGSDYASIDDSVTAKATITAGSGTDTLIAGAGPTTLTGGAGNDSLQAGTGADSLVGGTANNTLVAGSGNDTLVGHGQGNDYIFATEVGSIAYVLDQAKGGVNILDFSALTSSDALTVDLKHDLIGAYDSVTIHDAKAGQYNNFGEILDGQGDDNISANNNGDTIVGGNGYDTMFGGTGADLYFLGTGWDVVSCEGGADIVIGSSGNYVIYAIDYTSDPSLNNPVIQPSSPKPPGIQVYGGSGRVSIVGGAGDDTLEGSGTTTIHGMGGNDYISGGSGPSRLFGDAGNDSILAGAGDTTMVGGTGQDSVYAGTTGGANDFIDKNIPDNSTTAGGGSIIDPDALTANAIAFDQGLATPHNSPTYPLVGPTGQGDAIDGGSADMTVIGGAGNDIIRGADGPATLIAGSGNDLLVGGYGDDVLQGGSGVDTLAAGFGPDSMTGGTGDTTFFNVNGFADTVIGGSGFNQADADPTGETGFSNIQLFYDPSGVLSEEETAIPIPHAHPSVAAPVVTIASPTFVSGVLTVGVSTLNQAQDITISEANGFVEVVEANAVFPAYFYVSSQVNKVVVNGGPADDIIVLDTLAVQATVNAGNGNNFYVGGAANETVTTGSGNDTIVAESGNETISGGNGDNEIYTGTGNNTSVTGGSGVDRIFIGAFGVTQGSAHESDTIKGGSGVESIYYSGITDPLNARLDKGTITDNLTGAVTHISGVKNFYGGSGNSTIVAGTAQIFAVNGGSGNDTIFGSSYGDFLYGGLGSSFVYADGTQQTIDLFGELPGNIGHYAKGAASNLLDINATDVSVPLQHPSA